MDVSPGIGEMHLSVETTVFNPLVMLFTLLCTNLGAVTYICADKA